MATDLARADAQRDVIDDGQRTFRAANLLGQVLGLEDDGSGGVCGVVQSETVLRRERVLGVWLGWLAACPASAASRDTGAQILVLGDSLSAGYGIDVEEGWVALLAETLEGTRLRLPRRECQRQRRNDHRWAAAAAARPGDRTSRRSWCSSSAGMTACAGCRSPPAAENLNRMVELSLGARR